MAVLILFSPRAHVADRDLGLRLRRARQMLAGTLAWAYDIAISPDGRNVYSTDQAATPSPCSADPFAGSRLTARGGRLRQDPPRTVPLPVDCPLS